MQTNECKQAERQFLKLTICSESQRHPQLIALAEIAAVYTDKITCER